MDGYLTMEEYMAIQSIADHIDGGDATPDEILEIIKLLQQKRNETIARNMRQDLNA